MTGTADMVRILLVDDHPIVRQGMKQLLESNVRFTVAGEAGNGENAVLMAITQKPDVILMDVNLPKVSGYEATQAILATWHEAKIIVLTNEDDGRTLAKFMALPIKGYLLKDIQMIDLLTAIENVVRGETIDLSPELAEKYQDAQQASSHKSGGGSGRDSSVFSLTEREREILAALTKGYSNQQLANLFVVSQKTIHNHLYSIYSKIGVSSRTEAIVWAIENEFLKDG